MPPGAAFCPAFGGAFTVRFVIFSASSQTSIALVAGELNQLYYLSTVLDDYSRDAPIDLQAIVRKLPPNRDDSGKPIPAHGYVPSGPQPHPPATLSPSQLEGRGRVDETIEIGKRVAVVITDDDEMRRFGDAVHGFLTADRPGLPSSERGELALEVLERLGVAGTIEATQLLSISDRLALWIDSMWPFASWCREWPLLHRLPEGTVVRGTADLVVEIERGGILVDHKSFPGNRDQAVDRAADCAGQLGAYAAALAASGTPVLAAYVHLPISGLVGRIGISDPAGARG